MKIRCSTMRCVWCSNSARLPLRLLQRRLRIGYGRAAHLIDMMERDGLVGPADGSRPRELAESAGLAARSNGQQRVVRLIHDRQSTLAHLFIRMPAHAKANLSLAACLLFTCGARGGDSRSHHFVRHAICHQEHMVCWRRGLMGLPHHGRGECAATFYRAWIAVQVVDVKTGELAGEITGLREAHSIVFDSTGNFGYISDGGANDVKVFDRSSLQIVATIPTVPSPRALVFDPRSDLLFAVCTSPAGSEAGSQASCGTEPPPPRRGTRPRAEYEKTESAQASLSSAQTRAQHLEKFCSPANSVCRWRQKGHVYINMPERNQVLRLDAESIASLLRKKRKPNFSRRRSKCFCRERRIFTASYSRLEPQRHSA